MTNYEFVVWLEGYLDLCLDSVPDVRKLRIIRNHLNLVKAVEGSLGPLNTEIYELISEAISRDSAVSSSGVKEILDVKIRSFLKEAFPDSREDVFRQSTGT